MIWWFLGILVGLLALFVLLSPLESLSWWADRGEEEVKETLGALPLDSGRGVSADAYVVYLSGVGVIGGDQLSGRENAWLESLQQSLPRVGIVADVFPYAVDNRGLLQRTTVWLWSRLDRTRRSRSISFSPLLINLRNIAQVLVSADPRYGPTQSIGLAQEIWRSLQRHGYVPGSRTPVTLIGFSGGGQMSLGAAWFLSGRGIPTSVISLGGIFSDDPGLDRVTHLWQLKGDRDRLQRLGAIAFPGRWPTAPLSTWGRARREGRVTTRTIGPMQHDGERGYFGRRAMGPDGRSHADMTRDAVVDILSGPTAGD